MLQKTQAIALHSIRYAESSLIAYLYTQQFGRISVLVNRAYGRGKNKGKAILFQPLSLLNVVYYDSNRGGICRLSEVSLYSNHTSIAQHPIKRAISLFIGEVIYRSVREHEGNDPLFSFLEASIQILELMEKGLANFHLIFMVQLSRHLGFFPLGEFSQESPFFDVKKGYFVDREPSHTFSFSRSNSQLLSQLLSTSYKEAHSLALNREQRNEFLSSLISFYSYHLDIPQPFKSLQVLRELFSE